MPRRHLQKRRVTTVTNAEGELVRYRAPRKWSEGSIEQKFPRRPEPGNAWRLLHWRFHFELTPEEQAVIANLLANPTYVRVRPYKRKRKENE